MKAMDLTLWQFRHLCENCDCWECGYGATAQAKTGMPYRLCLIQRPREWKLKTDNRVAPSIRVFFDFFNKHCSYYSRGCSLGNCMDCDLRPLRISHLIINNSSFPETWGRILQGERKRMESLLEVKP